MPLYTQDQIAAIASRIKDVRFAMFTTLDDDQVLSSRPLTSQQLDSEGNLWFFTSDEADFTHALTHHPQVNVSFSNPDHQIYLSLTGQAYLLKNSIKARELWNPLLKAWFPRGLDDPHLCLIRVHIQSAEYWDASSSKMKQLLSIAKSALTGRSPVDIGQHTTICL